MLWYFSNSFENVPRLLAGLFDNRGRPSFPPPDPDQTPKSNIHAEARAKLISILCRGIVSACGGGIKKGENLKPSFSRTRSPCVCIRKKGGNRRENCAQSLISDGDLAVSRPKHPWKSAFFASIKDGFFASVVLRRIRLECWTPGKKSRKFIVPQCRSWLPPPPPLNSLISPPPFFFFLFQKSCLWEFVVCRTAFRIKRARIKDGECYYFLC